MGRSVQILSERIIILYSFFLCMVHVVSLLPNLEGLCRFQMPSLNFGGTGVHPDSDI